ncbi:hypothetical protein K402DRAFT_402793 [Aulographum hederae CBS 113979]|uniref:Uncharacterized protein n=1 Tax=Aulographum hederae CBS 113979 TaxID=1176131 RepID=A0A6G1H6E0_9PEZI|nr:hypothetical protein K402DRAFT_402793 [Aulographum hederae CBS 113979]
MIVRTSHVGLRGSHGRKLDDAEGGLSKTGGKHTSGWKAESDCPAWPSYLPSSGRSRSLLSVRNPSGRAACTAAGVWFGEAGCGYMPESIDQLLRSKPPLLEKCERNTLPCHVVGDASNEAKSPRLGQHETRTQESPLFINPTQPPPLVQKHTDSMYARQAFSGRSICGTPLSRPDLWDRLKETAIMRRRQREMVIRGDERRSFHR